MASNSIINPAPNPLINIFNEELWNNTDITISTVLPDNTVSLTFGDINTMTGNNTYNGVINYTNTPYFNDNWYLCQARYFVTYPQLFANYSSIYLYDLTTTQTITIPTASVDLNGVTFTFRRNTYNNTQLLSASANINNIDTLTNTNVILGLNFIISQITCAYNGSSYNWYMTYQY